MKNNNIIGSILILTLSLSGCTSWINQHKYQKFAQLSQQFINPQTITLNNEQKVLDGFQSVHSQMIQLSHKKSFQSKRSCFLYQFCQFTCSLCRIFITARLPCIITNTKQSSRTVLSQVIRSKL